MGDLTKYFSAWEFACPHCHKLRVDPVLLEALERLRLIIDAPFTPTSAYRCAEYNEAIGGAPHSMHTYGKAVDLIIPGYDMFHIYDIAIGIPEFRNGGIGLYPGRGHIHLDVRAEYARWIEQPNGRLKWKD